MSFERYFCHFEFLCFWIFHDRVVLHHYQLRAIRKSFFKNSTLLAIILQAKTHAQAKLNPFISHVGGPLLQSLAGGLILGVVVTFGSVYHAKNTSSMGEIFLHIFPTIISSMCALLGLGFVYFWKEIPTLENFGSELLIISVFFIFFIICIVPKVFDIHKMNKYRSNRTR